MPLVRGLSGGARSENKTQLSKRFTVEFCSFRIKVTYAATLAGASPGISEQSVLCKSALRGSRSGKSDFREFAGFATPKHRTWPFSRPAGFGVTGSGSSRPVVCRSGTKRLLILSPWDKMAPHFVLLGQTGWDCSGLEAVRLYRIRLFEARSLSLWDKIGLLFCRLGTKWPLILSSWDKLGGIVRDWRRFGVTGSGSLRLVVCRSGTKLGCYFVALGRDWRRFGVTGSGSWRLVVCRSGTKRLLILSPWDKMASYFVALGQTGWDCSGLEAVRRHRIRLLEARSLSLWDKTAPHFVALGQNGLVICRLGTNWMGLFGLGGGSASQDPAPRGS